MKTIKAIFKAPNGPRIFPGQGLKEEGDEVEIGEIDLANFPDSYKKKGRAPRASSDDAGDAGEGGDN